MHTLGKDKLHYVLSRNIPPALRVEPGDVVQVETEDSRGGRARRPEDVTLAKLHQMREDGKKFDPIYGFQSNPVVGPIYVIGAEPGDTLQVEIQDIHVDNIGYTGYWPELHGLTDWFPDPITVFLPLENGHYQAPGGLRIPLHPCIGTIGTAPPLEARASLFSGPFGGNMDCADITIGSQVFLRCFVPGGLLFLGDVHAVQGDGEFGGAIEVRSVLTLRIDLVKGGLLGLEWPRVETTNALVTIAADRPLEIAVETAMRQMVLWLHHGYGWSLHDAYLYLGKLFEIRPCQLELSPYVVRCRFPKRYLYPAPGVRGTSVEETSG